MHYSFYNTKIRVPFNLAFKLKAYFEEVANNIDVQIKASKDAFIIFRKLISDRAFHWVCFPRHVLLGNDLIFLRKKN